MENKKSEIKCLMCTGKHFRRGHFEAEYERFDEDYKINENADALLHLMLETEEDSYSSHEYSKHYTYVCEDCGFIMNFNKEKHVESKKEEFDRKKKEKMYDWTNFKN